MSRQLGIAAVALLAYALCDLLHEVGHWLATMLPLGVEAVFLSSIGLSTTRSSAAVAAAGPLANLVLASSLPLAAASRLSSQWRYFAWLFGTINLFNAAAYLLYSALLGTGDWAVVLGALAGPSVWRPLAGAVGAACYAACIFASLVALQHLVASGVVAASNVGQYCKVSYLAGGTLLTLAAMFNPVSPWFILTSGVATGFGAMFGLLVLAGLAPRSLRSGGRPTGESLRVTAPWRILGAIAAAGFVGLLGPGIRVA